MAMREAASARGRLSNPLRRHAHVTSAPPRNVGGARLLLAPCDHQGAGGRNEAPPAPVRCRWGLCSVILRGVEARRRQPKKWRRRNILSRGLSLSLSP